MGVSELEARVRSGYNKTEHVQNSPRNGFDDARRDAIACAGSSPPILSTEAVSVTPLNEVVLMVGIVGCDGDSEGESTRFGIAIDLSG